MNEEKKNRDIEGAEKLNEEKKSPCDCGEEKEGCCREEMDTKEEGCCGGCCGV